MHLENTFACGQIALHCCVDWSTHETSKVTHKSLYTIVNFSLRFCIILYAFIRFLRQISLHFSCFGDVWLQVFNTLLVLFPLIVFLLLSPPFIFLSVFLPLPVSSDKQG